MEGGGGVRILRAVRACGCGRAPGSGARVVSTGSLTSSLTQNPPLPSTAADVGPINFSTLPSRVADLI